GVGNLKMLVHEEIGPIIESAVNGLLRGEWPTWAGGFTPPPDRPAPAAPAPTPARPAPAVESFTEPPSETIRWTPPAEWFVQVSMGAQQLPEIPIMSSTLMNGRTFTIGGPGGSASDIQLDDKSLPDSVARLEYQNGSWVIMADTSVVPVYLGTQPLRDRRFLQATDELVIGRYRLRMLHRTQPQAGGAPGPRFALDILSAPDWGGGGRLILNKSDVTLGRDKACDMVFNDATVSRRHAQITLANGRVWLRPLSTTNPTFVNGVQVQQSRALDHGDEIQLSRDSSLRFVDLKEEVF
ncbi:MAG TPA: FHA domain-containing protein, partial [Candidatus Xenobia bacterium]